MNGTPWPTILTSVIVAAVSVISTIAYNRWAESRRIRLDCLRQIMQHPTTEPAFFRAFNEIPVVFSRSTAVIAAHAAVLDAQQFNGKPIGDLVKSMAADLGIKGPTERQLLSRFSTSPR